MLPRRTLISPAGALLALVCFFLPWGRFSCAGVGRTLSGADIGGMLWIVFAAALVIPAAVAAGLLLRRLDRARLVVAGSALLALGVMLLQHLRFARGQGTGFGRVQPEDLGVQLRLGGAGTVLGLLVALIGSVFLGSRPGRGRPEPPR
jgi:apolipoprotein N-acyltransferase